MWVQQQWRLLNITHMASYILTVISCHTQATRCICVNNVIRIIQFELYTTRKRAFYMQTKMVIYHIIWVQLATVRSKFDFAVLVDITTNPLFVFKQLRSLLFFCLSFSLFFWVSTRAPARVSGGGRLDPYSKRSIILISPSPISPCDPKLEMRVN